MIVWNRESFMEPSSGSSEDPDAGHEPNSAGAAEPECDEEVMDVFEDFHGPWAG